MGRITKVNNSYMSKKKHNNRTMLGIAENNVNSCSISWLILNKGEHHATTKEGDDTDTQRAPTPNLIINLVDGTVLLSRNNIKKTGIPPRKSINVTVVQLTPAE